MSEEGGMKGGSMNSYCLILIKFAFSYKLYMLGFQKEFLWNQEIHSDLMVNLISCFYRKIQHGRILLDTDRHVPQFADPHTTEFQPVFWWLGVDVPMRTEPVEERAEQNVWFRNPSKVDSCQ